MDHHPQEDLAKFGSRSDKKVDFFSLKLCYILATYQFQNGFLMKSLCFGHWPCYNYLPKYYSFCGPICNYV
jgi:hypothetical protein